ncbi:hypothetical protein [Microbacterium gubbeenense]|uniref:hypothetical protein n=1 Tax=Microbacterium gubbeenense TaxID=159896 RepID=UPI00048E0D1F|nr:hypothetical protein [Microbacterium gubbeenense]
MKRVLQIILSLALLAGFVWMLWWLATLVFSALVSMDGDTRGATIALVGVVSVPVITFATQFWLSKKNSREQAIREKRTEFYGAVIELFMSMLNSTKDASASDEDATSLWATKMRALTPQMILYGSKDFVRAWNTFRSVSALNTSPEGLSPKALHLMIASMEMMMLAARRDLGHRVRIDEQGDYVSIFINDVDQAEVKLAYQAIKAGKLKG